MAEECAHNAYLHVNFTAASISMLVILNFIALCFIILHLSFYLYKV